MKHIESIQPEYAAEELERIVREEGDATASAALTTLLHNVTGCAIPPTADTPQSEVEELVPLCLSILRRHWTTPLTALGDGTTPMSLADLMRRLILGRVDGNEALGIPPANADIPTAVAALTKRHIFNGEDNIPDGYSLARLLGSTPELSYSLIDNNSGWIYDRPDCLGLHHLFKGLSGKVVLGCESIVGNFNPDIGYSVFLDGDFPEGVFFPNLKTITKGTYHAAMFNITTPILDLPELVVTDQCRFGGAYDEINMPKFQRVGSNNSTGTAGYHAYQDLITSSTLKHLSLPSFNYLHSSYYYDSAMVRCAILEDISLPVFNGDNSGQVNVLAKDCPELLVIDMPSCEVKSWNVAINCPKLHTIVFGKISTFKRGNKGGGHSMVEFENCDNLIKIVIGEGSNGSIDLGNWSPTTALADKLPEFLSNFKTYIAQRLTDKGSGLTLTLSQAVRDAIQQDPEIVSIITSKGWTISPAPSV